MEGALDEDTQAALDGFVGKYSFSEKELETFKELVDNMRGTAWGLLAATGITALLSVTQQVPLTQNSVGPTAWMLSNTAWSVNKA